MDVKRPFVEKDTVYASHTSQNGLMLKSDRKYIIKRKRKEREFKLQKSSAFICTVFHLRTSLCRAPRVRVAYILFIWVTLFFSAPRSSLYTIPYHLHPGAHIFGDSALSTVLAKQFLWPWSSNLLIQEKECEGSWCLRHLPLCFPFVPSCK